MKSVSALYSKSSFQNLEKTSWGGGGVASKNAEICPKLSKRMIRLTQRPLLSRQLVRFENVGRDCLSLYCVKSNQSQGYEVCQK